MNSIRKFFKFYFARVGDKVNWGSRGNGIIISVSNDEPYPIFVKFEKKGCPYHDSFTRRGRVFVEYKHENGNLKWGHK